MQCLGFAGFSWWPFALVAFVPMLALLEPGPGGAARSRRRTLALGYVHGVVGYVGGYYWLVPTFERFSGYEGLPNWLFAGVFWLYMGGQQGLIYLLYRELRAAALPAWPAGVLALLALEYVYPTLFPAYLAAGFHDVTAFVQVADLGGPMLVSAVAMSVNVLVFRVEQRVVGAARPTVGELAALVLIPSLALGYGWIRIDMISSRMEDAPSLRVGVVQVDMGTFEKWDEPFEGMRRHHEQSAALLRREPALDLLVWPESAYVFALPRDVASVRREVQGSLHVPLLFGALTVEELGEARPADDSAEAPEEVIDQRYYNTAVLSDAEGAVLGRYDKTHLLAFGEYLPFGETFPELYAWSPNTGRFTPGEDLRPLLLPRPQLAAPARLSVLVCYEDVLPGFTRDVVRAAAPELLVNITNDAWFGDTQEPWIHLALAQFRAVEHHRGLVRSTNNGVSALIDPLGRVVAHTGVAERAELAADLPLLADDTIFTALGSWPGPLTLVLVALAIVARRRQVRSSAGGGKLGRA